MEVTVILQSQSQGSGLALELESLEEPLLHVALHDGELLQGEGQILYPRLRALVVEGIVRAAAAAAVAAGPRRRGAFLRVAAPRPGLGVGVLVIVFHFHPGRFHLIFGYFFSLSGTTF